MIAAFEGTVLRPYTDVAGVQTVCTGHVIRPEDRAALADGVTASECDELLSHDLDSAAAVVSRLVTVPLTQNQFDALASWQFNTGALAGSTLLRVLNAGDYEAAGAEFIRWCKRRDPRSGGLVEDAGLLARRKAEAALFLRPEVDWDNLYANYQIDLSLSVNWMGRKEST